MMERIIKDKPKMTERRIVRVAISLDLLIEMMTEGWTNNGENIRCIKGLPEDARWIGDFFDVYSFNAYLFFEHESFDIVLAGMIVPILYCEFERKLKEKGNAENEL